jgi:hypothetical protein
MKSVSNLVTSESFAQQILLIMWYKIMVYADFSYLYGVPSKALNLAECWNLGPFPSDFMYKLTAEEKQEELERKIPTHSQAIAGPIDLIRQLMQVPASHLCPIGLMTDISKLQSE